MQDSDRRIFPRMRVNFNVEVFHPGYGISTVKTRDMSDGGIFVIVESSRDLPPEGEIVSVKVKGLHGEEPILEMKIVRDTSDGVGLSFLH